eukprot:188018_1
MLCQALCTKLLTAHDHDYSPEQLRKLASTLHYSEPILSMLADKPEDRPNATQIKNYFMSLVQQSKCNELTDVVINNFLIKCINIEKELKTRKQIETKINMRITEYENRQNMPQLRQDKQLDDSIARLSKTSAAAKP